MTGNHDNDNSQATGNAVVQTLLKSLGNGGAQAIVDSINAGENSTSILKSFLGHAQLAPDQQSIVDLLVALGSSDVGVKVIEGEILADEIDDDEDDELDTRHDGNIYDLRKFRRELNDLRTVNDTLAAALGACPICWGGDDSCHECEGDGHAGAYQPDARLFNELVVPAIRRIRSRKRTREIRPASNRR